MSGPVYDDCPACGGTGEGQDWSTGNLTTCPECRGLGRKVTVINRQEEKERRRMERVNSLRNRESRVSQADKMERDFMRLFKASLVTGVLFTLALIALIVAVIIWLI